MQESLILENVVTGLEKIILKHYSCLQTVVLNHTMMCVNKVLYKLTLFCCQLQMSGYLVYNNTFTNCHVGSFIGGGRRNQVLNNSYHNCSTAVHEDNRGMSWQKAFCSPVSS